MAEEIIRAYKGRPSGLRAADKAPTDERFHFSSDIVICPLPPPSLFLCSRVTDVCVNQYHIARCCRAQASLAASL